MTKKIFLFISLFAVFAYFYIPSIAKASKFSTAYIRLNSLKANTSLLATACAQPSLASAGIENKVIITFPNEFSISSNPANWTTNTNDLPAGSASWPIGLSATSVSGKSVTFTTNDLTSDVLYCFNLVGSGSTTGNAGTDQYGTITTKTSSNSIIDQTTYAVSIVNNDQIGITASVDPSVSELPISIDSSGDIINMPQSTTITYSITYGLNTTVAFPLTITASWGQGTIQGNPNPSVDILDYVVGSASNGYNSNNPTVDLVNNKIKWIYNSFPANTIGQTVSFKLKTNNAYRGSLPVNFTVSTNSNSKSTTTPDQSLTQTYKYVPSSSPTPTLTPTPAPESSPTPLPSLIPTPTLTNPAAPIFTNVEVRTVSDQSAGIFIATNVKTKVSIKYGASEQNLNKSISISDFTLTKLVNLANLKPETQYFFKIIAVNDIGQLVTSDIFTLTTAAVSLPPQVEQSSIVVVSGNNIVYDASSNPQSTSSGSITSENQQKNDFNNVLIVPKNTNFQFRFSLQKKQSIKRVRLILRKINLKKVLGINTFNTFAQENESGVSVLEIQPGVYTAVISSDLAVGNYEIILSSLDENGNVTEEKLTEIKVTNPFTVLNQDKSPIEATRIFLYVYNENSKSYIPLSPAFLNIDNPSFTDPKGVVNFVLPKGKYKADISNLDYKDKTTYFTIQYDQNSSYPIVILERTSFDILKTIRYYFRSFNEVFLFNTTSYVDSLKASLRFFDLVSLLVIVSFTFISLFVLSRKAKVSVFSLFSYIIYMLRHYREGEIAKKYITGTVVDENNSGIPLATVYLMDEATQKVISQTKTSVHGEFYFRQKNIGTPVITTLKEGYKPADLIPLKINEKIVFKLEKIKDNKKIVYSFKRFSIELFDILFEWILIISLFFEFLFAVSFGTTKTFIFVFTALFNLFIWLIYLRHARRSM